MLSAFAITLSINEQKLTCAILSQPATIHLHLQTSNFTGLEETVREREKDIHYWLSSALPDPWAYA